MFLLYNQAFLYRINWFSILCNFLYVVTVIIVITTQQVVAANQVASNMPDSVRRANRNNALKAIAISGDSLVLWGSENTLPFTGVPYTKMQYTAKLNEHILHKIASKAAVPKEVLIKDEFETTQAFESRQKEYDKQYDAQVKAQASQAEQERPLIYADEFDAVLGRPVLNKVEYDADKETFNLSISAIWADYVINVKLKVPPANAKETKTNIESMNPWVVFQIEGEKVIPKSIILQNKVGTASSIKRLDFTDEQENQALLIGSSTYAAIKSANEKIVFIQNSREEQEKSTQMTDTAPNVIPTKKQNDEKIVQEEKKQRVPTIIQEDDLVERYANSLASQLESSYHPACQAIASSIRSFGSSDAPDYVRERQVNAIFDKAPSVCLQ